MVELLVTYLEATQPPAGAPLVPPDRDATIGRERPDVESYLDLYRAVGTPLQWDQRLRMPADELARFLVAPTSHLHILKLNGSPAGLCEFDGVGGPEVELTNFGLVLHAQGRRLGPWLLDSALRSVWSYAPRRVWLRTDTNDHPKAIGTYQRAGFWIVMRRVETFPD